MLVHKTVLDLLDAFSSPAPTPGGGSASALAGAIAASLLAMVAGMPKTKSGTPAERDALDQAAPSIAALRSTLVDLIDRDAAAYDMVVDAYRRPKGTEEEKAARKAAIQRAMRVATDVPLETARAAAALLAHGRVVAECGNANAGSDVGVALSLAMTAYSGARMNVETNLSGLSDPVYVQEVRSEMATQMSDSSLHVKAAFEALGWKGHEPPRA